MSHRRPLPLFPIVDPRATASQPADSGSDDGDDRGEGRQHRSRRKRHSRKRRRHHGGHGDRGSSDGIDPVGVRDSDSDSDSDAAGDVDGERPFGLESWPDEGNLCFEKPDPKTVPSYTAKVLGSKGGGDGDAASSVKRYFDKDVRKQSRHNNRSIIFVRPKRIKQDEEHQMEQSDSVLEFIPFAANCGDDDGDGDGEKYLMDRCRELNAAAQATPRDPQVWLDLASFQDEAFALRSHQHHQQDPSHLAEKKASVLEMGLRYCPGNVHIVTQLLSALEKNASLDPKELYSKWERILLALTQTNQNRNSQALVLKMWHRYLQLRCSRVSTFSVDEVRSLFGICIQRLQANNDDGKRGVAGLVASCIRFHAKCGNQHLAVAITQAVLEFNLRAPRDPAFSQLPEPAKVNCFRRFWLQCKGRLMGSIPEEDNVGEGWAGWYEGNAKLSASTDGRAAGAEAGGKHSAHERKLVMSVDAKREDQGPVPSFDLLDVYEYIDGFGKGDEGADTDSDSGDNADKDAADAMEDEDERLLMSEIDSKVGIQLKEITDNIDKPHTETFSKWLSLELEREETNWQPSISQSGDGTDGGDDDENAVYFEDIEDFLVEMDLHSGPALYDFLCMVGMCEGKRECSLPIIQLALLHDDFDAIESPVCDPLLPLLIKPRSDDRNPDQQWLQTLPVSKGWTQVNAERRLFTYEMLRCILLRETPPDSPDLWKELFQLHYQIAYGQSGDGKQAKKATEEMAKGCISRMQHGGNVLSVWCAYGSFEVAHSSINAACKVYMNVLASLKPSAIHSGCIPDMFMDFADLLSREKAMCRKHGITPELVLASLGAKEPLQSSSTLKGEVRPEVGYILKKARQGFQEVVQSVTSSGTVTSAVVLLAAAKFEKLQGNEVGAYLICDQVLRSLDARLIQTNPQGYLFCATSLDLVSSLESLARKKSLDYVKLALGAFPSSPKVLGHYLREEWRCGANFRLERTLKDLVNKEKSVFSFLALLVQNAEKKPYLLEHSFEEALKNGLACSCVVWQAYIRYEIHHLKNIQKAKKVYFRAIHSCPWAKSLILDGFLLLNEYISGKEKADLIDLMQDKGVHIHTDLFEVVLAQSDAMQQ